MKKLLMIMPFIALLVAGISPAMGHDKASNPNPADSVTDLAPELTLSWSPPDYAESHIVYFGTNFDDVNDCGFPCEDILKGVQTERTYDTGPILLDKTYYWRIDEVGADKYAKGDTWSFTTAEYITVDDMESYNDTTNPIWATWWDGCGDANGMGGNGTGSCIWLTEDRIRNGAKSMLYAYDNSGSLHKDAYSETRCTFDIPQNWTDNGEKAMVMWFYGSSENDCEPMYVALDDGNATVLSAYGALGGDANDVRKEEWQEWDIALQDFNDQGLDLSNVVSIAVGFGDRDKPQPGGSGLVYFDDIRLYETRCLLPEYGTFGDLNGDCVVDGRDLAILVDSWLDDHRFGPDSGPHRAFPLSGDVSASRTGLKAGFDFMTKDDYDSNSSPTWKNFADTGIDLTLAAPDDAPAVQGCETNGEKLCRDYFFTAGRTGSPDADLILTISNFWPGDYILTTYHNNVDSNGSMLSAVDVSGAVSDLVGDVNIIQTNNKFDVNCGSSHVAFTATGTGDVQIRYTVGDDQQAWFNGFVLEFIETPGKPYHPSPADGAENVGTNVVLYWSDSNDPAVVSHGEPITGTIATGVAETDAYDYLLGSSVFNLGPAGAGGRIVARVSSLSFGTAADSNSGSWLEIGFIAKKRADYAISNGEPKAMFNQSAYLIAYKTSAGNVLVMPADTNMNWEPPSGGPGGGGGNDSEYYDLGVDANSFYFVLDVIPDRAGAGGSLGLTVIGEGAGRTWRYGYDDWNWVDWKTGGLPDDPGIREFQEDFEPVYAIAQAYTNGSGGSVNAEISIIARQLVGSNNLVLDAQSMHVKPGDSVVIDMDVANLTQKVVGCQAILGYSSTYLEARPGCVIPGAGPWHELIYNSWDIPGAAVPGEIDTAIGIDLQSPVGAVADGTVAKITLVALTEGKTQIVFRPDANDVESTLFADMNAVAVLPTKLNSQMIIIKQDDLCFEVYFGDDWNAVHDANNASGEYRGGTCENAYDAGANEPLELFKTYYWRIDKHTGDAIIKGDVWTFTTGCGGGPLLDVDFTKDCLVNFRDYAILASGWLEDLLWP